MKKLLFLFIFIAFIIGINAQSTYWSTSGNNATFMDFLGTTNSKPLIFKTDSVERMRLTEENGYLGVGTKFPEAPFHLQVTNRPLGYELLKISAGIDGADCALVLKSVAAGIMSLEYLTEGEFIFRTNKSYAHFNPYGTLEIYQYTGRDINPQLPDALKVYGSTSISAGLSAQSASISNHFSANTMTSESAIIRSNLSTKAFNAHEAIVLGSLTTNDLTAQSANISGKLAANAVSAQSASIPAFNGDVNVAGTLSANILSAPNANIPTLSGNVSVDGILSVPTAKIAGTVCANEVVVSLSGSPCWPDYVFGKDYKLMPLQELEQFVSENEHLPNLPSATSVAENGIELGEMNAKLLQKVEELTLYIFDLQKQIDKLKSNNDEN